MARPPFFSVLIPTKNRSHIIGFAIESVLNQSFGDYEIVVSDNDDSPIKTHDAVKSHRDSRIKYFRTSGNLSMPDNWEFALTKATGRFVTVLQDKQVFYPNALELLYEAISGGHGPIISWISDQFDDTVEPPVLFRHRGNHRLRTVSSDAVISRLVERGIRFKAFPRMINSCISNEFVRFVQNETVLGRFFDACCPDFIAAFIQLNYIDTITYLDRSLNITGALSLGNGLSSRKKGETAKRFIREIGENVCFAHVPIKSFMANNAVINDYYRIRSKVDGRLRKYDFCPSVYLLECYRDIQVSEKLGTDMTYERRLWQSVNEHHDPAIRRQVKWKIRKRLVSSVLSQILYLMPGYGKLSLSLKGRTRPEKVKGYVTALEAAGHTFGETMPRL